MSIRMLESPLRGGLVVVSLAIVGLSAGLCVASVVVEVPVNSPGAIADVSTTNFTFTMAQFGPVEDVNLQLAMDHTYITDLTVTLVSPSDQGNPPVSVELFHWLAPNNEDAEFQDAVFDDDSVPFQQGRIGAPGNLEPPYQYVYQPQIQDLSAFDGIGAKGTWTLAVTDDEAGDTGQLYAPGQSAPWGTAVGTKLIVTIPEPAGMGLLAAGTCALLRRRRR